MFESLSARKQIFAVLFPIMMFASFLTTIFIPNNFQIFYLSAFMAISIGLTNLISSKERNRIVDGKLDSILASLQKIPPGELGIQNIKEPNTHELKSHKNNWNYVIIVGLVSVIISESVGFLLKSLRLMSFDYDLFKQILIVIIPIVGGFLTTYKITNSWQIRRDKIKMKEDVISSFKNSAKRVYNIQDNFVHKIINEYGMIQNVENLLDKGTVEVLPNFSFDNMTYPLLPRDFKETEEDLIQVRYDGTSFLTSLKFYYNNENLLQEYLVIQRHLRERWLIVKKWINSTTSNDFIAYGKEYYKKTMLIRNLIDDFDQKLIHGKLYNIPV